MTEYEKNKDMNKFVRSSCGIHISSYSIGFQVSGLSVLSKLANTLDSFKETKPMYEKFFDKFLEKEKCNSEKPKLNKFYDILWYAKQVSKISEGDLKEISKQQYSKGIAGLMTYLTNCKEE